MKAIGYVRVSTDRQAEQGVSLEAQEAKIRAMATVQGADLPEVIIDGGESAKNLNRPGLQHSRSFTIPVYNCEEPSACTASSRTPKTQRHAFVLRQNSRGTTI